MKKIYKTYKKTFILFISVILGSIIGMIFKEKAILLKPLGDIFLNLLLISVVPLIFISITSSIINMKNKYRLSNILKSMILVFSLTSIILVIMSFLILKPIPLINIVDTNLIMDSFDYSLVEEPIKLNILEKIVQMTTVDDFSKLFNTGNMLALMVVATLFGIAINKSGKKGIKVKELIISLNEVIISFINIIMIYAPVGLFGYFASLVGKLGTSITLGYIKTFIIYMLICLLVFVFIYSLFAYIAGGKKGVYRFYKNIMLSGVTALGTCSSAASIPTNIYCTKNIGVPDDIAEATITLGTSFHKDGSCIGSVLKIMFLVSLFGTNITTFGSTLEILGVSILATLVVTAIPIGGGTISEMLIISSLGYPVMVLPILTIIATIIDAPATFLNVVGDSASAMLVTRMVEGKDWIDKDSNIL